MRRTVRWVRELALALGAPGLFLVAFLDSSILSLPEIADLLVVWMVTRHKSRFVLYALSATVGSIAGCLLLYYIGKKGGDAFVRTRFGDTKVERSLASFRRHGIMAVLIPSLLPPPAPFKIFVLLAGLANISVRNFTIAIAIGRGARYFIEALLALRYGDRAMAFIDRNAALASVVAVGILLAGAVAYILWSKAEARKSR
jgi:membrane protein YqaA with SNARE-associated domain